MKRIKLTRGEFAIVDDADFSLVSRHKWHALIRPGSKHAARSKTSKGKKRYIYMHREIVGARRGQIVDHANRNGLDNRRENLRSCSKAQNAWNGKRNIKNKTSRFKGVCLGKFPSAPRPWVATISKGGKQIYLGRHRTQKEAALAYDRAAREYFGEFAATNFNGRHHV